MRLNTLFHTENRMFISRKACVIWTNSLFRFTFQPFSSSQFMILLCYLIIQLVVSFDRLMYDGWGRAKLTVDGVGRFFRFSQWTAPHDPIGCRDEVRLDSFVSQLDGDSPWALPVIVCYWNSNDSRWQVFLAWCLFLHSGHLHDPLGTSTFLLVLFWLFT